MRLHLLLLVMMAIAAPNATARDTGFLNRTVTVAGVSYRFQVYVPAEWTSKQKWPVILSLHGIGERGNDGLFSSENGLGRAIRRNAKAFPLIAVFPQCRNNALWVDKSMQQVAMAALESSIKEFSGDRQRIYLTGLSMGGYGVWEMAMRYPKHFAAIAPVCGALKATTHFPELHSAIVDLHAKDPYVVAALRMGPIRSWIFHGTKDPVIPVEESRRMAAALKAIGADVRYSEYADAAHNSWDLAYAEPEFLSWLMAQKKR
jgi:predicted peptidase